MQLIYSLLICFSTVNAAVLQGSGNLRRFRHKCSKGVEWSPVRKPKIIGGQVPPLGAVPWQISLRSSDEKHQCGGALISERLVLSAAHCHMEGLSAVAGAYGPPGEADK